MFGKHVKALREARGIGLRELARRIKISPTFISRVENGYECSISEETVVAWAEALGEQPDFLLALAGRIRKEIVELIRRNPLLYIEWLRALESIPESKRAEAVQKVKDGDW